jgi:sarcosine oxidase, subunit alpha
MITADVLVIGGGPAGLSAAIAAARAGAEVLLVERDPALGGQLVKQTHMFFGSEKQHAAVRGIDIARILQKELDEQKTVQVMNHATVVGIYEDGVVTVDQKGQYLKVQPKAVIVATGASEKFLSFANNDLPGIYGAGAVQTLMNVQGVRPGRRVLMVGAGNIGLIVSYQLIQAGVEVAAVIDAAPKIGGYMVHAAKIRRLGVPILTRHTIVRAHGTDCVTGATIAALDDKWNILPGTEQYLDVDVICIAVGLSALTELLGQAGVKLAYIPQLGGYVPARNENLMTTRPGFFVAGDVAGIEEASAAMVEGSLAGLSAARWLGLDIPSADAQEKDLRAQLHALRAGPEGAVVRAGLARITEKSEGVPEPVHETKHAPLRPLDSTGIPDDAEADAVFPSPERLSKGPVVVIECFREIPCNPCAAACPRGAIQPFADINDRPVVDVDRCNGCGLCISHCPGLAIRVVDFSWSKTEALIRLPYELLPVPVVGEQVDALDRSGKCRAEGRVVAVADHPGLDRTRIVSVAVRKEAARDVVALALKPQADEENTIICRCSDVTLQDIRQMIEQGFTSVEEIKRLTRAGMGPCQGKTCSQLIMREIARMTGQPMEAIMPAADRPLAVGIRIRDILAGREGGEDT